MNPRNVAGPRPTTGGTADDHHGRGIGTMLPAGAGESCSCAARFADQRNLSRHRIDNGPGHERVTPEPQRSTLWRWPGAATPKPA